MAEDISNGSLSWTARIDTSNLAQDAKAIQEILSKGLGVSIDTKALDALLPKAKDVIAQAEKIATDAQNTIAKNDVSLLVPPDEQKKQIKDVEDAAKKSADDMAAYIKSIPFTIKTGNENNLNQQQIDVINSSNTGQPISNKSIEVKQQIAAQSALNTVLADAKRAYADADATTKQYLDDLTFMELQMRNAQAAQKELNQQFKDGEVNQEAYINKSAELKASQEQIGASIKGLKQAQAEYQNQNTAGTEKEIRLNTELRTLRSQIARDSTKGIINPEDIARATALQKAMNNTARSLQLAASNTAFIDAMSEGVRGLVGGFTALSGVVGLFTDNNEEANKIMQDTIGLMGVLQGIEQVSQTLATDGKLNMYVKSLLAKSAAIDANTISTAANVVATEGSAVASAGDTAAKTAEIGATEGATAAQWSLNAALDANPVGVVIIALTALVGILYAIDAATGGVSKQQEELNKKMNEANKSVDEQKEKLNQLVITATDANASLQDREDAILNINKLSPEYLGNITAENIGYAKSKEALDLYIASLQTKASIEALISQRQANDDKINTLVDKKNNMGVISTIFNDYATAYGGGVDIEIDNLKKNNIELSNSIKFNIDAYNALNKAAQEGQKHNLAYFQQQAAHYKKEYEALDKNEKKTAKGIELKKKYAEAQKEADSYSINTKATPIDNSANAYKQMLEKIASIKSSFNGIGADKNTSIVDGIKKQFATIKAEIDKFNANPKNKIKISEETVKGIEQDENKAIDNANYIKGTGDLQKQLSDSQKQYQKYQDWKYKYGNDSANKEFSDNEKNYRSHLEQLKAETIANTNDSNRVVSTARLVMLNDLLKKEEDAEYNHSQKVLENALGAAQTQKDKIDALNNKYNEGRAALVSNGASKDELEQYAISYEKDIDSINKAFSKINIGQVLTATTAITKKQLETQISYLEAYVSTTKSLTKEQSDSIKESINQLREKALTATDSQGDYSDLTGQSDSGYSKQIEYSIKAAEFEIKRIQDAERQLLNEIKNQGGKETSTQAEQLGLLNGKLASTTDYVSGLKKMKPFAEWADGLNAASDILGGLVGIFKDIDSGMADTLDVTKSLVDAGKNVFSAFGSAKDAIKSIGSASKKDGGGIGGLLSGIAGNIPAIGSAVGAAIGAISSVVGIFTAAKKSRIEAENKIKEFNNSLITNEYKYQETLIKTQKLQDGIIRGKKDELTAQIKLNEAQNKQYEGIADKAKAELIKAGEYISGEHIEKYGGVLGLGKKSKVVQDFSGLGITSSMTDAQIAAILKEKEALNQLTGDTKMYADAWLEAYDNIQSNQDALVQLKESLTEAFAGTTADSIAQSIVDGFKQGKTSAEQFASDFNSIISNALLSSITNTLTSGAVSKIWDTLKGNIGDDGSVTPLTADEIATLKKQYGDAVKQGDALMQQAESIFPDLGKTLAGADGLNASIQGMTENTANALEGLFRNQLDQVRRVNNNLVLMLVPMRNIEKNTADTVGRLDKAIDKLDKIVTNTTQTSTTRDLGINV